MAAKAPRMEVSLLIYISQGQVTQVRESKQQYNTLHPPLVETNSYHAVRSKSKDATIHQKETKFDQKGRSAGTVVSSRRCTYHPQERKVLYISIDGSRTMASYVSRNRE